MSSKFLRNFFLTVFALLGLGACGGPEDTTAGGGIGGTGISFGTVSDFGSIFVNGVEFNTNGATIVKDDVGIAEDELHRGMTVEVRGSIDSATSGTATDVAVKEAVRGPVESKTGTASAGTLIVLGQTILVDETTRFDNGLTFDAIGIGHLLEVHGLIKSEGTVSATFLERKTMVDTFVVRGFVATHNATAQTFAIGFLTVNYNVANINDMPPGDWNDLLVEVKGIDCTGDPQCGTLTATKVEPDGLSLANAARAEIEGFVTNIASPMEFTVGNQTIVITSSTVFSGGLASDIVVGAKLEVKGSLAGGILTATRVSFKDNARLESDVATVNGSSLTLVGLPEITVSINNQTEIKDGPVSAGQHVRVRGRASNGNTVIATEIEVRDADNDVVLQGPVQVVTNPNVTILSVTVDTSPIPNQNFEDINDNPIGSTAFFNALTVGKLVKVQGQLNGGSTVTWDEIELED